MTISIRKIIHFLNILILVFLSLHVITSQFNIAVSSIGLGGMIVSIILRLSLDKELPSVDKKLVLIFMLFVFSHIISSIFSLEPSESFYISRRVLLFITFFAVFLFINNFKQLKIIFICFIIFTSFISLIELIRYFIDFYSQNITPISEFRIEYFGYPITNAQIKMLILILIVPFILTKNNIVYNKILLSLLAVPILISLFFTNSRNAFLGLFAGLTYIGFVNNKYFLYGLILFIILFLLIAPFPLKERVLSIADFSHPSIQSRFIMWQTGFKIFYDYPVLGIGDIGVAKVYKNYKPIERHGEGSHMHNNALQILITLGMVGLLLWLCLMIYIFIRQIKIYSITKNNIILNNLVISSIASMIAFQISGLTEWNFGDFEFAAVLWFNLGLAFLAEKFYINNTTTL